MVKKAESPIIVNVNRNRLQVCGEQLAQVMEIGLGADVVSDLTVVSPEKLEASVAEFIKTNGVAAAPVVIILASDVCFEHDIPKTEGMDLQEEVQHFLDTVPLASVSSKVFETGQGYRVVAISRDFYEAIRQAFEKEGFKVQVVLPGYVLGAVGASDTFDIQVCQLVLRHLEAISGNGFELENKAVETFSVQRSKFFNSHKIWVIIFCFVSLLMLAVVSYLIFKRGA